VSSIQILIISLKESKDRQEKVKAEMAKTKLSWNFLEAINGEKLDFTVVPYYPKKVKKLLGYELTPKELGCYLSHMKAWSLCIENKMPTLIFEDDFVIGQNFEKILESFLNKSQEWDIVRLQALCESQDYIIKDFGSFKIVGNFGDPLGATAYLINPKSAKNLLNHSSEIYEPLDHFLEHEKKHGLSIIAIKPYPITVADPTRSTSTISDRPERLPIRGINKFFRSFYRFLDRLQSPNPYFPK